MTSPFLLLNALSPSMKSAFASFSRKSRSLVLTSNPSTTAHFRFLASSATTSSTSSTTTTSSSSSSFSDDDKSRQTRLLDAALKHVPSQGWSVAAIRHGAHDLGWSPAAAGVVPRGEADLVLHFVHKCNAKLVDALESGEAFSDKADDQIQKRLGAALKFRLAMLEPYVSTWPQAMAVSVTSPSAAREALSAAWRMVDDIWHFSSAGAAGAPEGVVEYRVRRKLLLGAYVASELHMLTDYSAGFQDTWDSVDKRVARVVRLEKDAGNAAALSGVVASSLLRRFTDSRKQ